MTADLHAGVSRKISPSTLGALVRVLVPSVLVSLIPVTITAAGSPERRFAWAFAATVFVAGLIALLGEWCCRPSAGHCTQCDYDLTGNTTGVCPECGSAARDSPRSAFESFIDPD